MTGSQSQARRPRLLRFICLSSFMALIVTMLYLLKTSFYSSPNTRKRKRTGEKTKISPVPKAFLTSFQNELKKGTQASRLAQSWSSTQSWRRFHLFRPRNVLVIEPILKALASAFQGKDWRIFDGLFNHSLQNFQKLVLPKIILPEVSLSGHTQALPPAVNDRKEG